jgi:hypothetical protein
VAYFLDSNVIIGYYFACGDPKGKSSIRVFETGEVKYSSSNVWSECWGSGNGGRCRTISYEIADEFSNAIYYLNTGMYDTDDLLIAAVDEGLRIREIIEYLYERYSRNVKIFINRLRDAQRKYENECNNRKNRLNDSSVLTIHHRTVGYPAVEKYFGTTVPDHSDVIILVDAHDLGTRVQDLVFISGDGNHILTNKEKILQMSSFDRIISLNSF